MTTTEGGEPRSAEGAGTPGVAEGSDSGGNAPETGGSGEAAKYRRRLRETEGERDALAERLTALQRREVERLAGQELADGADLWLGGVELAELLDDAGNVDPGKVTTVAAAVLADRPHWAPRGPTVDPDQGRRSEGQPAPRFADFLAAEK